jgi:Tol biopolymer transport system component
VAFESKAKNLVPDDTNQARDVFVRDRESGETERVSISTDGGQAKGESGDPSIGANGRYVAFESRASNLVPDDTNHTEDIFVHDRKTGETTRVSVSSDGTQGDKKSGVPSISADGRFVAFVSKARNLVAGDTNGVRDIFVHDRETSKTTRLSVSSDGTQGNRDSSDPSISGSGRYVAFASKARNLVPDDTNKKEDIFVHDRQTGETTRVSIAGDATQGNRDSEAPAISADGRFVAFVSQSSNLVAGDTNKKADVFVHDRKTGKTTRVSIRSDGGQGKGNSQAPSISASGRFVAFESQARLVEGDRNRASDVFVRDRSRGLTVRVSVGQEGRPGDDDDDESHDDKSDDGKSGGDKSDAVKDGDDKDDGDKDGDDKDDGDKREDRGLADHASISADGAFVGFRSGASNLVPGDTNRRKDVFLAAVKLNRPPDAMDDSSTTLQETPVDIDVLANDTDPDGDPLSIIELTQPGDGTVSFNADDTVNYAPALGFHGTDTFTYTVSDGQGGTDTATVTVTVEPLPPTGPEAKDDTASTVAGTPVTIEVLTNDTGEGLSVTDVTDPPNGTAEINPDNTITYISDPGFSGLDTFDYTVTDSSGATDTATVNVTVEPPPLIAVDDQATTTAGEPVDIDVLANDSGTGLTVTNVTTPAHGLAELLSGTTIRYTPDADFVGPDSFEYTITDSDGASDMATVTVDVEPAPLVAEDDEASTVAGNPVTIAVLDNDSGTGLTVTDVGDPPKGTAEINSDDSITYTPDAGFVGLDSFTYTITDAAGATATAKVTVTVEPPPNTPPEALDDHASTFESVAVIIDVLANDFDADQDPLMLVSVTQPANGTASPQTARRRSAARAP